MQTVGYVDGLRKGDEMNQRQVTVLMPVFNGEKYIREAIDSILNQTFKDFEFLIVCAPSTDKSIEIIQSYTDERIRLVEVKEKHGLIADLNMGLDLAQGKFIARMDCDDISLPNRLEKQIAFMEANPDVGICGSWIELIGNNAGHIEKYPVDYEDIKANLFFSCALAHPTVVFRNDFVKKYGLMYDSRHLYAEDFGLWKKCSFLFPIVNLPYVLLKYRNWSEGASKKFMLAQVETLKEIGDESLSLLGLDRSKVFEDVFTWFCCQEKRGKQDITLVESTLQLLLVQNENRGMFTQICFRQAVGKRWFDICYDSPHLGIWVFFKLVGSPLFSWRNYMMLFKLFIKCVLWWK